MLTNYSHKSGGFRNTLSKLRTVGYIDGRGEVTITDARPGRPGRLRPFATGEALRDWWKDTHLGKAERAILDVLAAHWPAAVDTATLADETGYSATSGGFRNALSKLRGFELASGRGELVIADTLMDTA